MNVLNYSCPRLNLYYASLGGKSFPSFSVPRVEVFLIKEEGEKAQTNCDYYSAKGCELPEVVIQRSSIDKKCILENFKELSE